VEVIVVLVALDVTGSAVDVSLLAELVALDVTGSAVDVSLLAELVALDVTGSAVVVSLLLASMDPMDTPRMAITNPREHITTGFKFMN
jgi:hypothetical protein